MPTPCAVSGTLQTLTSGAIAQGQVIFQLINIGTGNPVVVSGTSILPALSYKVSSAQDGSFSTNLWGNDVISPAGTLYSIIFRDLQGNQVGPVQYSIAGASANLNTLVAAGAVTPPVIVPGAVLLNPTAPQTITGQSLTLAASTPFITQGTGTHSGTETFSGALVAPAIGPSAAQQHTLPAVVSDTVSLLAATQTLTNKTISGGALSGTINTGAAVFTAGGPDLVDLFLLSQPSDPPSTGSTLRSYYNLTANAWRWNPNNTSYQNIPQAFYLTSPYTNATTAFTNIPNMSFFAIANTNYVMSCEIVFQGSATTAGPKFQLATGGPVTAMVFSVDGATGSAAYANQVTTALATPNTALGTLGAATTNFIAHLRIGILASTTGTVQLQAAANGAGTLTIQPGSYCTVQ
jgi:hypothetical protein